MIKCEMWDDIFDGLVIAYHDLPTWFWTSDSALS